MAEEETTQSSREIKPPTLLDALIPILALIIFLGGAIFLYGDEAISGPTQVALILCTVIAGLVGLKNGHRWADMGHAAVEGISTAMGAIFILLAVGALVGTWMMSGTIATLVHLGIQWLNPDWYYLACVIICALLALSIGSSWTVVGTLGVGLIGIANALGVSPEITAGAVISGSYFGDKMSPLSETTNLAPAVAGIDLFTHIKGMMWTAVPSIIIASVVFAIIGFNTVPQAPLDLTEVLLLLETIFNIGLLTLIPLLGIDRRISRWVNGSYPAARGSDRICQRSLAQRPLDHDQGRLVCHGYRVRDRYRIRRAGHVVFERWNGQYVDHCLAHYQCHGLWRRTRVHRAVGPIVATNRQGCENRQISGCSNRVNLNRHEYRGW
jgi:hypothetical protein